MSEKCLVQISFVFFCHHLLALLMCCAKKCVTYLERNVSRSKSQTFIYRDYKSQKVQKSSEV